ncbi:DUF6000 family protein [Nonomuraea africana]|uniref:DUF6000 family protein n=1 Tax=Nonomuraea africana TaxID=46171 RepID=UPI0033C3C5EF
MNYRLTRKYVAPGRRYFMLLGPMLMLPRWRQLWFQWRLRRSARRITTDELRELLASGWREKLTAAWLAGVDRRTELRDHIGQLLVASEMVYAGGGYCFALSRFGTEADAEILVNYLNRWLRCEECDYDQGAAIGALMFLDEKLGANRTASFLAPGGLWEDWAKDREVNPAEEKHLIEQYHIIADGGRPAR